MRRAGKTRRWPLALLKSQPRFPRQQGRVYPGFYPGVTRLLHVAKMALNLYRKESNFLESEMFSASEKAMSPKARIQGSKVCLPPSTCHY